MDVFWNILYLNEYAATIKHLEIITFLSLGPLVTLHKTQFHNFRIKVSVKFD